MASKIDPAAVERLVYTGLAAGLTGMSFVGPSEPEPTPWVGGTLARLVRVDVAGVGRSKGGGDTDLATVVVAINVTVTAAIGRANVYAARAKAAVVAALLDEARLSELGVAGVTAGHEHSAQFERCEIKAEPADEQRGIAMASVIVTGLAQRITGTSILA